MVHPLHRALHLLLSSLLLLCTALTAACGDQEAVPVQAPVTEETPAPPKPAAAPSEWIVADGTGRLRATTDDETLAAWEATKTTLGSDAVLPPLTVDYPMEGSVFPPEFVPPTFLWHDDTEGADRWWVEVRFSAAEKSDLRLLVPGVPPPPGEIDAEAIGPTNEVYQLTPYQASAHSWTPSSEVWESIKERSGTAGAVVTFVGFAREDAARPLSKGHTELRTSEDPVGSAIFYRDVPLMPAVGETGTIQPLGRKSLPLIAWRLRDVSMPESRVVLTGMPSCANCHSFSQDGSTFGMDVDGPDGDKGMYALVPVEEKVTIEREDVLTWNSFPDKPKDHKTIGFLSRVSPNGRYVLSTVNESLYVANFRNFRFLQVFFPTRGILALYDRESGTMRALPGADDPEYVHCDPVWSPDGETIVFARGRAFDNYDRTRPMATFPNDPNEPEMHYDLYRMTFRGGKGGIPIPIEGASQNGMSNTFPKVSPDGKWVVYTKCRNGQLMRPDGRLWIVPLEGGEAREMRCNTSLMNSWHSFSPNGRWMVFSSKVNTPYTQMFLTHLDEEGNDTPPILIPNSTAANRAVNIPEFTNGPYEALKEIEVPVVAHFVHFQRAQALIREDQFAEAIPHLEAAIASDPEFGRAHAALAHASEKLGRLEDAIQHYGRALASNPQNYEAHTNLGTLLIRLGETARAMEHWKKAIEINPYDMMAHNNVGMVLAREERWEEATRYFERVLELKADFTAAKKSLGTLWLQRGRDDEALRYLLVAAKEEPRDLFVRSTVADILLRNGRTKEALVHLESMVDLSPRDARGQTMLAWVLATSPETDVRNGDRAVELAVKACEATNYREPSALDALAAGYAETGRWSEAVEIASRALGIVERQDVQRAREIRDRVRRYRSHQPFRDRR